MRARGASLGPSITHNSVSNSENGLAIPANGKHKTSIARNPDPLWDVIVELYFKSGVSKHDETRIGKIVRDLGAKNATPEQVRTRHRKAGKEWDRSFSPEALVKNWDQLLPSTNGRPSRKTLTLEGE